MDNGDGEFNYAYFCLQKYHWAPSVIADMDVREKAIVFAMIDRRVEQEKKHEKEMQKKQGRSAGRSSRGRVRRR